MRPLIEDAGDELRAWLCWGLEDWSIQALAPSGHNNAVDDTFITAEHAAPGAATRHPFLAVARPLVYEVATQVAESAGLND